MNFVDRKDEQSRLRRQMARSGGAFIVIYGRRRLGKSALIRQVLGDSDVYYMAEKSEMAVQQSLLQRVMADRCPAMQGMTFGSWESLLVTFNELCQPGCTLVLDEFPYLVRSCKSLPSTLQKLLDSKQLRFNLIVCGSSQRMMQRLVLDASEPLYGRADERMLLRPIAPVHWQRELQLSAAQAVEEYSVWGGVPRYWELREREDSFEEALRRLVLHPNGLLYDEPAALFMDMEGSNQLLASVMTALGAGFCQFSRLASAVGKKTTELSVPLKHLAEMAYVSKEVPFGEAEEKTKKTLYRIADPFMAFYYRFVVPNKSLLAMGRIDRVWALIQEQMPDHVGQHWETLCRQAVSGNTLCGHDWLLARRWWGKALNKQGEAEQIELDVVAESMDGKALLVGECKWNKADYSDRLLRELERKTRLLPFAKGKKVVPVLFLRERPLDAPAAPVFTPAEVMELL